MELEQILKMDNTSVEFFEIYSQINEKYWTFDNPDDDQQMRQVLNLLINRGDAWHVELCTRLMNDLFKMVELKTSNVAGSFGVKGKEYWYQFTDNPKGFGNIEKLLRNTLIKTQKDKL